MHVCGGAIMRGRAEATVDSVALCGASRGIRTAGAMPRIGCICHGGNGDSPRAHLPLCGPRAARSVQAEALADQEPGELLALRRRILPGLVLRPAARKSTRLNSNH